MGSRNGFLLLLVGLARGEPSTQIGDRRQLRSFVDPVTSVMHIQPCMAGPDEQKVQRRLALPPVTWWVKVAAVGTLCDIMLVRYLLPNLVAKPSPAAVPTEICGPQISQENTLHMESSEPAEDAIDAGKDGGQTRWAAIGGIIALAVVVGTAGGLSARRRHRPRQVSPFEEECWHELPHNMVQRRVVRQESANLGNTHFYRIHSELPDPE